MLFYAPEHLIYTNRGSTGLWGLLLGLGKAGMDVIMPAGICEIVPATVIHANMRPVFCDVSPITGNMTLENLETACTKNTVACIAVHNYGRPVDIAAIKTFTKASGICLIEDVCNAFGAMVHDAPLGIFGDAAFFSFGYAKILEVGSGGAVWVKDRTQAQKIRGIIAKLPVKKGAHRTQEAAFQAALKNIRAQNAMACLKALYAKYLPALFYQPDQGLVKKIKDKCEGYRPIIAERREKAVLYRLLLDHPDISHLPEKKGAVFWRYTIRVPHEKRDALLKALRTRGFHASAWYPPVHHLFDGNRSPSDLPGAFEFGKQVVNLWLDDQITFEDIRETSALVRAFFEDR